MKIKAEITVPGNWTGMDSRDRQTHLLKEIRQELDGTWKRTVWFGLPWRANSGRWCAQTGRCYHYLTRAQARRGDISDDIGSNGRCA